MESRTSKLILAVNGKVSVAGKAAGREARTLCLKIIEEEFGELPPEAFEFQSFETLDGQVRAEAAQLDDIDTWALRFAMPDPEIPGRDWITELSSLVQDEMALFSCRLLAYSAVANFEIIPSPPYVLRALCRQLTLQDHGHVFNAIPQVIGTDLDVTTLLRVLSAEERWWNCIVVSHAAHHLDPTFLQARLTGIANCYILPNQHEMEFAAAVGYDFTVEQGGFRVYRPGFDPLYSEITAHPAIRQNDTRPANVILDAITKDCFAMSVARPNIRVRVPSFASIRQLIDTQRSDQARESGNVSEQIKALEQLVRTEQRNTEEAIALAIQSDEERQSAADALANEQAINHGLRARIENLELQIKSMGGQMETEAPTKYADIKRWVSENFSGKLRLTTRAEKGLRDARYEKIEDVTAGLRLLAEDYRGMKMGSIDPQDFDKACRGLGLEETRSVSKVTAGQHGDAYFVIYAGKKQFLDRHLKKGTAKDERHCLRIYFFWDAENEIVVVGSLPGHLNV